MSSVFFISTLEFSVYISLASLVKFIPRYFILFSAFINEIIFLIYFSDSLVLLYRKVIDFCTLILYPATY